MNYEEYFGALCASIPCLTSKGESFLKTRLRSEGIIAFQRGLKLASDTVMASLASTGEVPSHVPFLCKDCICPGAAPFHVLDLLSCFNKLQISNHKTEAPWDDFLSRNSHVSAFAGWCGAGFDRHNLSVVKDWIESYLGRFVPTLLRCKHGPGQTAERLVDWDKWLAFDLDKHTPPSLRMVSVPKDVSGDRLIGIEYTERQWFQQGLAHALRETRFFKNYFMFRNNDRHLALACQPTHLTIDLKDASDRISPAHVEAILPHRWYSALLKNTSTYASTPSRGDLHLSMFATMGLQQWVAVSASKSSLSSS